MKNYIFVFMASLATAGCVTNEYAADRDPASADHAWEAAPVVPGAKVSDLMNQLGEDGRIALDQTQLEEVLKQVRPHCDGRLDWKGRSLWMTDARGERAELKINWDPKRDFKSKFYTLEDSMPKLIRTWLDEKGGVNFKNLVNPHWYRNSSDYRVESRKENSIVVWGYYGNENREVAGSFQYLIRIDEKSKQPDAAYFSTVVQDPVTESLWFTSGAEIKHHAIHLVCKF